MGRKVASEVCAASSQSQRPTLDAPVLQNNNEESRTLPTSLTTPTRGPLARTHPTRLGAKQAMGDPRREVEEVAAGRVGRVELARLAELGRVDLADLGLERRGPGEGGEGVDLEDDRRRGEGGARVRPRGRAGAAGGEQRGGREGREEEGGEEGGKGRHVGSRDGGEREEEKEGRATYYLAASGLAEE